MTTDLTLTPDERDQLRAALAWCYPPNPEDEAARQAADLDSVVAAVERILATRATYATRGAAPGSDPMERGAGG